ncbi:Hypothetical protein, putative [Bodo saltans]|uniref:BTB domain-containing protein n=1 Tax=Bodo saltans TaxID=75058 RepID=A0A0S4JBF6_BODSA|nr:Hypothetical protein, putative [Bodo saltans]|eukprot:CUG86771.1 Hypothetical protein, putative [Bodo saltans]
MIGAAPPLSSRGAFSGPISPSVAPSDASLFLHRIVLSQSCPSYFGTILHAPLSKGATSTSVRREVRWVREDRLAPEVCTTAVPVVLRYIYSGVLGVLSPGGRNEIAPLEIDDVCAVLIVGAAWCCGPAAQHEERLTSLVSYLYEYFIGLCDAANNVTQLQHTDEDDVRCTLTESIDDVPHSQIPMTLPSPKMNNNKNNSASPPSLWSREELIKNFMKFIATVDALAAAQEQLNERLRAHQEARHQHLGATVDESHVVRTSDIHQPLVLFPAKQGELTLADAAVMQRNARFALSGNRHASDVSEVDNLTTTQQIFGSLWFRIRESLIALTVASLGSELLLPMLPEIVRGMNDAGTTTSSSSWDACVVNIYRDCETKIADPLPRSTDPTSLGSQQDELVFFATAPSVVAETLGVTAHQIDKENFFCGASLRTICWLVWRWSMILLGAVNEASAARRELLSAVCDAYVDGLPTEESISLLLAQKLDGDGEMIATDSEDDRTQLLVNLGRACRMHDILRLQQAALSRLAAAMMTKLLTPNVSDEVMCCQADIIKASGLSSVLPWRFATTSSSFAESLPHSLWNALSTVVSCSPGRIAVRCGATTDLICISSFETPIVAPMVVWTAAVAFRDARLVRWMLQEYFAALSETDLANATQNAPQAPSLWSALSLASATMVTSKTPGPRKRGRSSSQTSNSQLVKEPQVHRDRAVTPRQPTHPGRDEESLPLFSTFVGREILTALSPVAAHFPTNPESLFPITMDERATERVQMKASTWDEVLAEDHDKLTSWMGSVQELCDKLFRNGPPHPPPAAAAEVNNTASTGDSVATEDDNNTTQHPTLLTADDEGRVRQSTLALRKQLDESRRVRETHAENIRLALRALLTDELREAQDTLSSLTTETLKPAMDEVRALEASRACAQHEMKTLQSHIDDLTSKLESVQKQCTSQLDTARAQLTQYRGLVEKQELRASRMMDSLDTHIIPALEAKRSAVLTKMLETVSGAVSTLREQGVGV